MSIPRQWLVVAAVLLILAVLAIVGSLLTVAGDSRNASYCQRLAALTMEQVHPGPYQWGPEIMALLDEMGGPKPVTAEMRANIWFIVKDTCPDQLAKLPQGYGETYQRLHGHRER